MSRDSAGWPPGDGGTARPGRFDGRRVPLCQMLAHPARALLVWVLLHQALSAPLVGQTTVAPQGCDGPVFVSDANALEDAVKNTVRCNGTVAPIIVVSSFELTAPIWVNRSVLIAGTTGAETLFGPLLPDSNHFQLQPGANLTLHKLTLFGGTGVHGGCVAVDSATLALWRVCFDECASSRTGGSLHLSGGSRVVVTDSIFRNSWAVVSRGWCALLPLI